MISYRQADCQNFSNGPKLFLFQNQTNMVLIQQMASIKQWFNARQRTLATILFNLYMLNLPSTSLNLFQYADNIVLTHQARKFDECEIHLEKGLETMSRFFHQYRLRPNLSKTEVCAFHLGTHDAHRKLTVQFDNDPLITHVDHPKYLGMTLDRTLSYKLHLEKLELT
jgi:hypothetical protein